MQQIVTSYSVVVQSRVPGKEKWHQIETAPTQDIDFVNGILSTFQKKFPEADYRVFVNSSIVVVTQCSQPVITFTNLPEGTYTL